MWGGGWQHTTYRQKKKKAIKKETGAFYRDGKCIKWIALKNGKQKKKTNKQETEGKEGTGAERTGEEREVFNSIVKASYE